MMKKVFGNVKEFTERRHPVHGVTVAWTDGACEPNPGDGGWGVVVEMNGVTQREYSGSERNTTNNRMELVAVIEAIERTTGKVVIRTDSQLVLLCAIGRWKRKKNIDLWERYAKVASGRDILFEWWRGHSGTHGNERADKLACEARKSIQKPRITQPNHTMPLYSGDAPPWDR